MSAAEVARQLAAAPPPSAPPTATPTPTLTPSPSSAGQARVRRTLATDGGLIVATCSGSLVTIETMSPAQGYTVHERDREPRRQAEAEFRSVSDDQDRVKVEVRCVSGVPTLGVHD